MEKDFISQSKQFWSGFPAKVCNKKLLIEEPTIPMMNHTLGIFSVVLNQAKSLKPVWLYNGKINDTELLKSYVDGTEFVPVPEMSRLNKITAAAVALWSFIIVWLTGNIIAFRYKGVKYGDIVYDTYLKRHQVATIKKIDTKLLRIIYECIRRHESIRKVLLNDNFGAVLVSHQIGLRSGIMLRTAIRYGYKGYLRAGHHLAALQCFEKADEVYNYEYKPLPKDIDDVICRLGSKFDEIYAEMLDKQFSGCDNRDAVYAFGKDKKYYKDKLSFVKDFGLDPQKKTVFVMLHAFNDNPHAHFRWMLFRDYYDWFVKTLDFAKRDMSVNWVFKQHPSVRFYVTKDVDYDLLFSNCPKNIIYMDEEKQIDTRSLICCADLVVTCQGSAGVELPAMARVPSLIASESFYSDLGFALEPKTKKEYFGILSNAKNINHITENQQKRAKAAYMYIHKFAKIPLPACPRASLEQEHDGEQNIWYWMEVAKLYRSSGDLIKKLIYKYIDNVSSPTFKQITQLNCQCDFNNGEVFKK